MSVHPPKGCRMQRRGTVLGTFLMIGISAIMARGDHPAGHSALRRPPVQLAKPFFLQDIQTESSTTSASLATPDGARIARAAQYDAPPQPEFLPRPLPGEIPRDAYDPGIKPMNDVGIDITTPVQLDSAGQPLPQPNDFASAAFMRQPDFPRDPAPTGPWFSDAAYGPPLNFCYRPLYFEESNLERYGRTAGIFQPLVSAGNFYGSVAVLPYRLVSQRSGYCTYHDHHFRPGAPAPREWQVLRPRLDAATVQAAAIVGLILLIP